MYTKFTCFFSLLLMRPLENLKLYYVALIVSSWAELLWIFRISMSLRLYFMPSFIQSANNYEHQLWAKHSYRHWRYSGEQNKVLDLKELTVW